MIGTGYGGHGVALRDFYLLLYVLFENGLGEFAAHAPGEDYQSFIVLREHFVVTFRAIEETRSVGILYLSYPVKTLEVSSRH